MLWLLLHIYLRVQAIKAALLFLLGEFSSIFIDNEQCICNRIESPIKVQIIIENTAHFNLRLAFSSSDSGSTTENVNDFAAPVIPSPAATEDDDVDVDLQVDFDSLAAESSTQVCMYCMICTIYVYTELYVCISYIVVVEFVLWANVLYVWSMYVCLYAVTMTSFDCIFFNRRSKRRQISLTWVWNRNERLPDR